MLPGLPDIQLPKTPYDRLREEVAKLPVSSEGCKLAPNQRGLILPSPLEITKFIDIGSNREGRQNHSLLRPEPLDLRQAILFWDAIQLPEEMMPSYGDDRDVLMLENMGMVRRYRGPTNAEISSQLGVDYKFIGSHGTEPIFNQLRLNLFSALEKSEPGQWAMGRGIRSPEIPDGELNAGRGVLVKLTNMLPIPDGSVNFQDVLEFRQKRNAELVALRTYMTNLFADVSDGKVDEMVRGNLLLQFETSIKAYQAVLGESGIQ